jgi:hypothetical protein
MLSFLQTKNQALHAVDRILFGLGHAARTASARPVQIEACRHLGLTDILYQRHGEVIASARPDPGLAGTDWKSVARAGELDRDRFVMKDMSSGLQLNDLGYVGAYMDECALPRVMAERLRLRADLWRRDAAITLNRDLSQLMLRSAEELEEEAAGLDARAQAQRML